MLVSPLLSANLAADIMLMFQKGAGHSEIEQRLTGLPLEEQIHLLRLIFFQFELTDEGDKNLLSLWEKLLSPNHPLNTKQIRDMLWAQSGWWDAFQRIEWKDTHKTDEMEKSLDTFGQKESYVEYFKWVTLHPPYCHIHEIWDEHRRGAITSLGRYAYHRNGKSLEVFLCRHLDDWINVQMDTIDILVAMKSRLFAKLGPWYMENDPYLRPFLKEYFS